MREKIHQVKSWLFVKTNEIDNSLARFLKTKESETGKRYRDYKMPIS